MAAGMGVGAGVHSYYVFAAVRAMQQRGAAPPKGAVVGGDVSPNAGTHAQTVDRLFGGDVRAWSSFDPSTVISHHGTYTNLSGLFAVPGGTDRHAARSPAVGQTAAESLCGLGAAHGIDCSIVELPG